MDKPGKEMLEIKNWRPLYKIYSKILANRLYKVLPDLIHHDQSGFLKGRLIGDNLLDLISVMEHCSENNLESVILSLDFEKVFDTVNEVVFVSLI